MKYLSILNLKLFVYKAEINLSSEPSVSNSCQDCPGIAFLLPYLTV